MVDYQQNNTYQSTGTDARGAQVWPWEGMSRAPQAMGGSAEQAPAAAAPARQRSNQPQWQRPWMQDTPEQYSMAGQQRPPAAGGQLLPPTNLPNPQLLTVPPPPPQSPGSMQIDHGLSPEVIGSPSSVQENYQGSLKALLARNIGFYVVATFLIGTQNTISWEGVLYSVGNDYLVLWQEDLGRFIVGNIYSLKFLQVHSTRDTPACEKRRQQSMFQSGEMA